MGSDAKPVYHVEVHHDGTDWIGQTYKYGVRVRTFEYPQPADAVLTAWTRWGIRRLARQWIRHQEQLDRLRSRPGFTIEGTVSRGE